MEEELKGLNQEETMIWEWTKLGSDSERLQMIEEGKGLTEKEIGIRDNILTGELRRYDLEAGRLPMKLHHKVWVKGSVTLTGEKSVYAAVYKGRYGTGFVTYRFEGQDGYVEKDYWVVDKETPLWIIDAIKLRIKKT